MGRIRSNYQRRLFETYDHISRGNGSSVDDKTLNTIFSLPPKERAFAFVAWALRQKPIAINFGSERGQ